MADVPLAKSPLPLDELDGADAASDGQVPTSDGVGGVAWETPSGGGSVVYPERQDISVMPTPDVVSGTWTSTAISTGTCQRNTPTPTNGDYVEWNVLLQAGTWSLDAVLTRFAAAGIAQFSVDGSNVGSAFDCYAASTTPHADHSATGIVIATTAVYPVRLTVAGKNASASGYGMALEALALKKTA